MSWLQISLSHDHSDRLPGLLPFTSTYRGESVPFLVNPIPTPYIKLGEVPRTMQSLALPTINIYNSINDVCCTTAAVYHLSSKMVACLLVEVTLKRQI